MLVAIPPIDLTAHSSATGVKQSTDWLQGLQAIGKPLATRGRPGCRAASVYSGRDRAAFRLLFLDTPNGKCPCFLKTMTVEKLRASTKVVQPCHGWIAF